MASMLLLIALTSYDVFSKTSAASPFPANIEAIVSTDAPGELRVLSYNVFLRPKPVSSGDYTLERAEQMGQWLADASVDIVALQEAWEPEAVATIVEAVRDKLPYYVVNQPARESTRLTSGGLLILSRWPIQQMRTLVYDQCWLADCLAAKGALHVVIRLSTDTYLNVVTTHLEAGRTIRDLKARASQIEQLRQFMAGIDADSGPTLLTGDFNIDALAANGDFERLVDALGIEAYGASTLSTVNCALETSIFCDVPIPAQQIDHIFTRYGEQQLFHNVTRFWPLATKTIDERVRYLSDHRAVQATFATNFH